MSQPLGIIPWISLLFLLDCQLDFTATLLCGGALSVLRRLYLLPSSRTTYIVVPRSLCRCS